MGRELSDCLSTDIYLRYTVDFTSNVIVTEASDFVHLRLPAVHTSYELNPLSTPATRFRRPTYWYHWSAPGRVFGEATAVGIGRTRSEQNYSYKTGFETRRENQDFGRQNISMSRLPLDSTHLGTNTTNVTTSSIDSIPLRKKKLQTPRL